jgi:glutathione S-transferase
MYKFLFAWDLCGGRKVGEWPKVEQWLKDCGNTESWKRAVEKTGYEM